jgi:hypothetical protein
MAFTEEIAEKLGFYVYRLIDPRNGETFYVGRGRGNRVFHHAADELGAGADVQSEKLQRIRRIRSAGFKVAHVIHRHGLDSHTAIEVEAALIDAYPGTTNVASGHEADERGVMHADEIIRRYQAPVARFEHDLVLISVNWSALERSIYEAVRHAWKIDPRKAAKADYVLGVHRGLIVGVFKVDSWLRATAENFPGMPVHEDRWGFVGREAPEDVQKLYLHKRLPDQLRARGSQNPIRYATAQRVADPSPS